MSISLLSILVLGIFAILVIALLLFIRSGDQEEEMTETDRTAEILKKVRKIEIKTKGLSTQIFSGEYQTAFKGRGMSFSEVRSYQYGDDVRNIDWNVTARSSEPYIKVFEEERELTAMLLIDVSGSSFFGSSKQAKDAIIAEISAVLSFSAINNNDKVGVIFFSDKIEKYIPPKKGKQHILLIIRELIEFKPEGHGTDLSVAIQYLNNIIKKRSIAFILSDFMTQGYEDALRVAARRHDITAVRIYDSLEVNIPNIGLVRSFDAESNQVKWIDTAQKSVRQAYNKWYEDNVAYFKKTFLRSGSSTLSINTEESYTTALIKFFKKRH